jgi:small subunit ribosomal protein S10e
LETLFSLLANIRNTDDCCDHCLEGVLVAKKDFNAPRHQDIPVPNLEVIKAMQSLTSRGYVKTRFSWQYYYYTLTNEGIDYLRSYLHLPAEIVPATFKKAARPIGIRPGRPEGERREGAYRPPRGDREGYRRRDDYSRKEGAAGDFRPQFVSINIA